MSPTEPHDASIQAPVTIKDMPPRDVVFIEHTGAYWAIGSATRRVWAYMERIKQPGPFVIRYPHDPRGRAAASLVTQVGFVVTGDLEPESPFMRATWPGESVAFITLRGRAPSPRRDYKLVYEWIEQANRMPAGPVTEVYLTGRKSPLRSSRAQLQVALQPETRAPMKPAESASATSHTPPARPSEITIRMLPAPTAPNASPPTPPTIPKATPRTTKPVVERRTNTQPVAEASSNRSVAKLLAAGEFDQIAERLMPTGEAPPDPLRAWLGEFTGRVDATARGIRQVYPESDEATIAMANAIVAKHQSLATNPDPQETDSGSTKRHRQLIRTLDELMGRISFRSTTGEEATADLVKIVEQAILILKTDVSRPETSPDD